MNNGKTIKYINGGWVIRNFGNVRELFWWWHSNYGLDIIIIVIVF